MNDTIIGLEKIVRDYTPLFQRVSEESWISKTQPGKWSKKEILTRMSGLPSPIIKIIILAI